MYDIANVIKIAKSEISRVITRLRPKKYDKQNKDSEQRDKMQAKAKTATRAARIINVMV